MKILLLREEEGRLQVDDGCGGGGSGSSVGITVDSHCVPPFAVTLLIAARKIVKELAFFDGRTSSHMSQLLLLLLSSSCSASWSTEGGGEGGGGQHQVRLSDSISSCS